MEEIFLSAMEIIHENYIKSQTVKLVVDCAHQAFIRLISLYFYQHNDYVRSKEIWGSDRPPQPSPPDSWAPNQIPICRKIDVDHELNTVSKIDLSMKGDFIASAWDGDTCSRVSSSDLYEDVQQMLEDILDSVPLLGRSPSSTVREIEDIKYEVEVAWESKFFVYPLSKSNQMSITLCRRPHGLNI